MSTNSNWRKHLFTAKQYLLGFSLTLIFLLLGHFAAVWLPLPAPVIGLLLCAAFCAVLGQVPKPLLLISQLLLSHMALFFLPLIVSATLYLDLIKQFWLPLAVSLFVSTLLAMAITAKWADKQLEGKADE